MNFIIALFIASVFGGISICVSDGKKMDDISAFYWGFLLGPLGVLIVALTKSKLQKELEMRQLEELRKKQG